MKEYRYKARRNYRKDYASQQAEKMPYTEFKKLFPDNDICLEYVWNTRYGNMKQCVKCKKHTKYYRIKKRKQYSCGQCGHQIAPLSNTPFMNTKLPLSMWFYAMYLFSITKNGLSAKELERILGVHYETAWGMLHKISYLVAQENTNIYFHTGTTEIDDSYFGGKVTNKHSSELKAIREKHGNIQGRSAVNKAVVIGAVNREQGKAQVAVLDTKAPNRKNTDSFISDTLDRKHNNVITDDWTAYMKLSHRDVHHSVVAHGKGEYGRGDIHTNNIENLWSNVKRSLDGTYRGVSKKYLQKYLDEFVFRYNHRGQKVFYSLIHLLKGARG